MGAGPKGALAADHLIVAVLDGVLSSGEAAPFDFAVLQRLAEVNDRARHEPQHPAVTLCTGRPAPYVRKCSCRRYTVSIQPSTSTAPACMYRSPMDSRRILPSLQACRHNSWNSTPYSTTHSSPPTWRTSSQVNPSLNLFARAGVTMHEVARMAEAQHASGAMHSSSRQGATCVNVMVRGLDKAEGVRWLARETGIPLHALAG